MHCRLTLAAALVAAMILPTAHASADCKGDVEGIEKRIKQAKVRATYKGREAEHPEVLIMTGGKGQPKQTGRTRQAARA